MVVKLYEKKSKANINIKECDVYRVFRYCPNCNTDFLGTWFYENENVESIPFESSFSYTPVDVESRYIQLGSVFTDSERKKYQHNYGNCIRLAEVKPSPWARKFRKEIDDFLHLKICPICGGNFSCSLEIKYKYDPCIRPNRTYGGIIEFDKAKIGEEFFFHNLVGVKTSKYDAEFYDADDDDSILRCFQRTRSYDATKIANENVDTFVAKCSSRQEKANLDVKTIKSDSSLLTEIISNTVKIETNIFAITERLRKLYRERILLERELRGFAFQASRTEKDKIKKLNAEYASLTSGNYKEKISLTELGKNVPTKPIQPQKERYPEKPSEPILKKAILFNRKKIAAENEKLMLKYKEECDNYKLQCEKIDKIYEQKCKVYDEMLLKYQKALPAFEKRLKEIYQQKKIALKEKITSATEAYDKLIKNKGETIIVPEKFKLELVNEEICKSEDLLSRLYIARRQIYDSGLIFGKYCNFVAMSSFCEYLSSGRCTSLEGPEGAYNIYESEIRMNLISTKLDNILNSLDQIKENQYAIYSAIQETNMKLTELNETMKIACTAIEGIKADISDIKKYTKSISDNTNVIAHYSKINAFYSAISATLTTHGSLIG